MIFGIDVTGLRLASTTLSNQLSNRRTIRSLSEAETTVIPNYELKIKNNKQYVINLKIKKMKKVFLLCVLLLAGTATYAQDELRARIELENAETAYSENRFADALKYLDKTQELLGKWSHQISYLRILSLDKVFNYSSTNAQFAQLQNEVKMYMDYCRANPDKVVMDRVRLVIAIEERMKREEQVQKERMKREQEEQTAWNKVNQLSESDLTAFINTYPNSEKVAEAEKLLDSAQGNPEYEEGKKAYESKDYSKALEWCTKAADKGNASAMFRLGYLYSNGLGVEQNYSKAFEWYAQAAEKGNVSSMNNLGNLYKNGNGVELDYAKAHEWFTKSAEKGNADAMTNLGELYENGNGVERDYAKAHEWYTKSAKKGNEYAKKQLQAIASGEIEYAEGKKADESKDYSKALEWYAKAADKGNDSAMFCLGYLYYIGGGVERDYVKACEWFIKAADKGNTLSMMYLEMIYNRGGYGVKKNKDEAKKWEKKYKGKYK